MSFFLVPTDTPGFIIGKVEDKLGQNISDTAQIILEQCIIPDDAVMGEPNMALPATMGLLSDGRISAAAQSVGIARAAFETARDYVKRSEEHTSELQSLMRISYAVFCLKKKNNTYSHTSA